MLYVYCSAIILFAIFLCFLERYLTTVVFSDRVLSWKKNGFKFTWEWTDPAGSLSTQNMDIFYCDSKPKSKLPILLLLHGYPTSSYDWHKIYPKLCERPWRIIAPDFIGYGFSSKPKTAKFYFDSISIQADMIEALLQNITGSKEASIPVHVLSHDYGDSVAQELLHRSIHHNNDDTFHLEILSTFFLNGGMVPGVHRPILMQKVLASSFGWFLTRFMNKRSFSKSFSRVLGIKPSKQELSEFWSLIKHNNGNYIQHGLIKYMAERNRKKQRWIDAIVKSTVPLCLLDGPADPVSGLHLATAVADLWNISISHHCEYSCGEKQVSVLPPQFGHYPQTECPSLLISHFFAFMQINFPSFFQ